MTTRLQDTELYRKLVATGMPESQAAETVQTLDRMLGSELQGMGPAPEDDPFLNDIRAKALRGRYTVELTHDQIMQAGKKDE
jgi:hypothetical protein